MSKRKIYQMGWFTLLVFPIPAFIVLYFTDDITLRSFFDIDRFSIYTTFFGLLMGVIYAIFANLLMKIPVFKTIPLRVDQLVKSMNLNLLDSIFLSLCAGIGEELLFRVGFQHYLGIPITAIVFVALHGYLNPLNWRQSLYGLVVLPLAFILGYSYHYYGLWSAVAIHFAYDLTLFLAFDKEENKSI